jgi:winged helix DNA-binding protein
MFRNPPFLTASSSERTLADYLTMKQTFHYNARIRLSHATPRGPTCRANSSIANFQTARVVARWQTRRSKHRFGAAGHDVPILASQRRESSDSTNTWVSESPRVCGRDRNASSLSSRIVRKEIVRRYLAAYSPATLEDWGRWWGIEPVKAKRLLKALGEEVEAVDNVNRKEGNDG